MENSGYQKLLHSKELEEFTYDLTVGAYSTKTGLKKNDVKRINVMTTNLNEEVLLYKTLKEDKYAPPIIIREMIKTKRGV